MDKLRARLFFQLRRLGKKPGLSLWRLCAALIAAALLPGLSQAQTQPAAKPLANQQDAAALSTAAESYLRNQLAAVPGAPTITMDPPRTEHLAPCTALSPFMSTPLRLRPRMSVGMRCAAPHVWTTYVQATVSIAGQYYVAAQPLSMGRTLQADDFTPRDADLVSLPTDVVYNLDQAVGMQLVAGMATGQMLRAGNLRSAHSVQRGQTVKITISGAGFKVTNEGQAMANAGPGDRVQVRTASGQIVNGIVQPSGEVKVPF
jgi:flagella basal body P-ring formation protein FlgA